jgi:hypothetical protein
VEKCGLQLPGTCDSSDGQPAIAEPLAKSVLPSPENWIMEEGGWTIRVLAYQEDQPDESCIRCDLELKFRV